MKKTAGLAILILAAIVFAYIFRLQALGFLDTSIEAAKSAHATSALKNGLPEDEADSAETVFLRSFPAGEALYRRGNRYYVGENKEEIDMSWPFFADNGTALYYAEQGGSLITSDFASFEPYSGLFISDGKSYTASGDEADDEEYIMASTSSGIFFNAQPLTITEGNGSAHLRLNSAIWFMDHGVRWYEWDDGAMSWHEAAVSANAAVRIGSVNLPYAKFLEYLNIASAAINYQGIDPQQDPEPLQDKQEDHNSQGTGRTAGGSHPSTNGSQEVQAENADAVTEDRVQAAANDGAGSEEPVSMEGTGSKENIETSKDPDASASGGEAGSSGSEEGGSGDSAGSSDRSGNGQSGNGSGATGSSSPSNDNATSETADPQAGQQGNTAETPGSGMGTDGDGSGSGTGDDSQEDDSGEDGWTEDVDTGFSVPVVTLGESIRTGVYTVYGDLSIEDPQGKLIRVIVQFWQNGKIRMRKNLRREGSFSLSPLEPGESYTVKLEMVYRNASGVRCTTENGQRPDSDNKIKNSLGEVTGVDTTCYIHNRTAEIQMLGYDSLIPLTIGFTERTELLPHQIGVDGLSVARDEPDTYEDDPLDFIARGTVTAVPQNHAGESFTLSISAAMLRQAAAGQTVSWLSAASNDIPANTDFDISLSITDRYGHSLPVTDDSRCNGYAFTCLDAPTAKLSMVSSQVGRQTFKASITSNQVTFDSAYFQVLNDDEEPVKIFASVPDGDGSSLYQAAIATTGAENTLTVTELPSASTCRAVVIGSYYMNDTLDAGTLTRIDRLVKDEVLKRISVYTASISRLGSVYADLSVQDVKALSFTIQASLDTEKTAAQLLEMVSSLSLSVKDADGATAWQSGSILESEALRDPGNFTVDENAGVFVINIEDPDGKEPRLTVPSYSGDTTYQDPWEALIAGEPLAIAFPAYGDTASDDTTAHGFLESKTRYSVSLEVTAEQGGMEIAVGAKSNAISTRTLRLEPSVHYSALIPVGDFYELRDFYVWDPDETLSSDGAFSVRLAENGLQSQSKELEAASTAEEIDTVKQHVRFTGLRSRASYRITFQAKIWNTGFTSDTHHNLYNFGETITFTAGDGVNGSIEMSRISECGESPAKDGWDAYFRIRLDDPEDVLGGTYTLRLCGAAGINSLDSLLTPELADDYREFTGLTFDGSSYDDSSLFVHSYGMYKYKAELIVTVNGESVVLDSTVFTTESGMETVSAWDELRAQLKADPYGKYAVTEDMEVTNGAINVNVKGTVDFQGHTVSNNGFYYLFSSVSMGGVLKNIVLDFDLDVTSPREWSSCFVVHNYGTLQNIVADISIRGRYQNRDFGGFVRYNWETGVIENFASKLSNEYYGTTNLSAVAAQNYGTIRNGYVYGKQITLGSAVYGGRDADHSSSGGVVGNNAQGAVVENVFSLIDLYLERSPSSSYTMKTNGGIVGKNLGIIQNSFWAGDIYTYYYDDNKAQTTPATYTAGNGAVGNGGTVQDVYNVSLKGATYQGAASEGNLHDLWNSNWYTDLFNSNGNFTIDNCVTNGLYPKVAMPSVMDGKQEDVALPEEDVNQKPVYVSSSPADEGSEDPDEQIVNLSFRNTNAYPITFIEADGVSLEILEQENAEGSSVLKVRLYDPTKFRTGYKLLGVSYKRNAAAAMAIRDDSYAGLEMYIDAAFYRSIRSAAEWSIMNSSPEDNFRLDADVDFSGATLAQTVITEAFSGVLDGNGYTVKNLNLTENKSYVFKQVSGATIRDLTVDGFSVNVISGDSNLSQASNSGFFAQAADTEFSNILLRDVALSGVPGNSGALIGKTTRGSITDCRAEGVTITTASYRANSVAAGGLVGQTDATQIKNCYVQSLSLDARQGSGALGIGGLAGSLSGGSMENAYAQGEIQASFMGVGGIVGASTADISHTWAWVDIESNAGGAGGILGQAEADLSIYGALSLGNIMSGSSGQLGRIYGSVSGSYLVDVTYGAAYSEQTVGQTKSDEILDATSLCDGDALNGLAAYRDQSMLGSAFELSGEYPITDGYLPMLYDASGDGLLDGQTPVLRQDPRLKILAATLTQNTSTGTDATYRLQVQAETGESGYELDRVECSGLSLDSIPSISSGTVQTLTYSTVSLKSYLDIYTIKVYFKRGDAEQTLPFQVIPDEPAYRDIHNSEEWVKYLTGYGQNFENFRLAGDVDLSGYQVNELPANLHINSLIAAGKHADGTRYQVSGMSYRASVEGESLIASLTGEMRGFVFKDMSIDATSGSLGGSNTALIGNNQGTIQDMQFDTVTVKGGVASRVGIIGTNLGTVTGVSMTDTKVSVKTSGNNSSKYTGGLIGYNAGTVSDIQAGSSTQASDFEAWDMEGSAPASSAYLSAVEGRQYTGGIAGYTEKGMENITISGTHVYGSAYTGGIIGYSTQTTHKNLTAGSLSGDAIPMSVTGSGSYTGGILGYADGAVGVPFYLYNGTASHIYVTGKNYTGGIAGCSNSWSTYLYDSIVDNGSVNGTGSYTGGVSGYGNSLYRSLVKDSCIAGTSNTGGIAGCVNNRVAQSAVANTVVTGSTSCTGGILGYLNSGASRIIERCSVLAASVTGGTDTADQVGGICGSAGVGGNRIYNCSVTDTEVSGYTRVGGVIGLAESGTYYNINCEAYVSAEDMAGGFAGQFYDFEGRSTTYPLATARNLIIGGLVESNGYAGGLFGSFTTDEPLYDTDGTLLRQGNTWLDQSRYYGVILADTSLSGGSREKTSVLANYTQNANGLGTTRQIHFIGADTSSESGAKSAVYAGIDISCQSGTPVTIPDLVSRYGYQAYNGGNAGTGMFTVSSEMLSGTALYKALSYGFGNTSTAALSKGEFPYRYGDTYRFAAWDGTDLFQVSFQDGSAVDTFGAEAGDGLYDDGVFRIPDSGATAAAYTIAADTDGPYLTVYASGPAALNLELGDGLDGVAICVEDGSGLAFETQADRRVYTVPYSFDTDLTVRLSFEDWFYKEYTLSPGELAHTVSMWEGNYYYLTDEGVRCASLSGSNATESADTGVNTGETVTLGSRLLEGEFLNLYQKWALDWDGVVWDLEAGDPLELDGLPETGWFATSKPLYEFDYNGTNLKVFGRFTLSNGQMGDNAGLDPDGNPTGQSGEELDILAYVKDNTLFPVDGSSDIYIGAVLADEYQGTRYLTVLSSDGALFDLESSIALPDGFENGNIAELAPNLDDDTHMAIGRTLDGKVFAFNYFTGTVYSLEDDIFSASADLELADYIAGWAEAKVSHWFASTEDEYAESACLISMLNDEASDASDGTGGLWDTSGSATGNSGEASGVAVNKNLDTAASDTANGSNTPGTADMAETVTPAVSAELTDSSTSQDGTQNNNSTPAQTEDMAVDEVSALEADTGDTPTQDRNNPDVQAEAAESTGVSTQEETGMENGVQESVDQATDNENAAASDTDIQECTEREEGKDSSNTGNEGASAGTGQQTEEAGETAGTNDNEKLPFSSGTTDAGTQVGNSGNDDTAQDMAISSQIKTENTNAGEGSEARASGGGDDGESTDGGGSFAQPGSILTGAIPSMLPDSVKALSENQVHYISVYNQAKGTYEIYDENQLLTSPRSQLTDLSSQAREIYEEKEHAQVYEQIKETAADPGNSLYGTVVYGVISVTVIILLLILNRKRRRKDC